MYQLIELILFPFPIFTSQSNKWETLFVLNAWTPDRIEGNKIKLSHFNWHCQIDEVNTQVVVI